MRTRPPAPPSRALARLTIVRHGETEWNVAGRLQGASDSALTARGRLQSEATRAAIAGETFAAAYSSDLGRAQQTAEIVVAHHALPIRFDPRLRELAYGVVEGMTWPEIQERDPALYAELQRPQPHFAPPGGESRAALQARMVAALREIASAHAGEHVFVVTHGNALGAFLRHVLHLPLEAPSSFRARNCALNTFEYHDGRFHLVTWGALGHLEALG